MTIQKRKGSEVSSATSFNRFHMITKAAPLLTLLLVVSSCISKFENPWDKNWIYENKFDELMRKRFISILSETVNIETFISKAQLEKKPVILDFRPPPQNPICSREFYNILKRRDVLEPEKWAKDIIERNNIKFIASESDFRADGSIRAYVIYERTIKRRVPPGDNPWSNRRLVLFVNPNGEIVAWSISWGKVGQTHREWGIFF